MNNKLLKRYSAVEGGFSYVGAVVAYLIMLVIMSLIAAGADKTSTSYEILSFIIGACIQLGFLAAAFLPAKCLGSRLTYSFKKVRVKTLLLAPLLTVVCVIGFDGLAIAFNAGLGAAGYVDNSAVSLTGALIVVLTVVQSVVLAPVCEETLFRGSILSSLGVCGEMSEKRRIPFMIITCGLLFSFMHMNPTQTVYQFFFGCALAYAVIRFGSVIPAIIMHATNNIIALVLCVPVIDDGFSAWVGSVFASGWGIAVFLAASAALAVGAAFLIRFIGRKFGGLSPESPVKSGDQNGAFHNFADDGGTLAGAIMTAVGFIICLILWISTLVGGFSV